MGGRIAIIVVTSDRIAGHFKHFANGSGRNV
jgi:hypothetical protein